MSENKVQETSEEDRVIEPEKDEKDKGKTIDDLSADELKDYIRKLNRENAKHRTEKQTLKEAAEKWNDFEESKKSELERAEAKAAKLERELEAERLERVRIKVARKAGLDVDFADRVRGNSEEEMLEDAKSLAEYLGKATKDETDTSRFAGRRGGAADADRNKSFSGGGFLEALARDL